MCCQAVRETGSNSNKYGNGTQERRESILYARSSYMHITFVFCYARLTSECPWGTETKGHLTCEHLHSRFVFYCTWIKQLGSYYADCLLEIQPNIPPLLQLVYNCSNKVLLFVAIHSKLKGNKHFANFLSSNPLHNELRTARKKETWPVYTSPPAFE